MSTGGKQRQGGARPLYCRFTATGSERRREDGLKVTQVETGVTDDAT